jgi:hypothetical protein
MAEKTPSGLPKISDGVVDAFLRDHNQRTAEGTKNQLYIEMIERATQDNPALINFFRTLDRAYEASGNTEHLSIKTGVIMGYELLRRQVESDSLDSA